jgi:hypothetical protein
MELGTCQICHQEYERPSGRPATSVTTHIGNFGITRQVVKLHGSIVHECPPLPELLRADRSLLDDLLIRALERPTNVYEPVKAVFHHRAIDDRLVTVGLLADALSSDFVVARSDEDHGDRQSDLDAWQAIRLVREQFDRHEAPRILVLLTATGELRARARVQMESEGAERS